MVMVNLSGNSEEDEATGLGPGNAVLGRFTDSDSDGMEEDKDEAPAPVHRQTSPHDAAALPRPPPLPPSPMVGFQNLGLAIQIAVESSDVGSGTIAARNKRAADLVRAMIADAGPAPGAPSADGLDAFASSEALDDVVALVRKAAQGELKVCTPARFHVKHPCLQAVLRCFRGRGKN